MLNPGSYYFPGTMGLSRNVKKETSVVDIIGLIMYNSLHSRVVGF